MDHLTQATKNVERKMELLKRKVKIEKDRATLMEKTEEVKKMVLENRAKRATLKKKKIRI